MTREEAITAVKEVTGMSLPWNDRHYEALQMALTALSAQTDGDVISRQAAIELIEQMKPYHQDADDIAEMIANMPSAQSERFKSCKNCIHLGHGYMMPCKNCRRNQVMPDWYEVET